MVLNSASAGPVPDRCVLPKLDIASDINVPSKSLPLRAPPPQTSRTEVLSVRVGRHRLRRTNVEAYGGRMSSESNQ